MISTIKFAVKRNVNLSLIALALLVAAWIKFFHAQSSTDDLLVILTPVNSLIELLHGSHSAYQADEGFYHASLSILIDKSCAGVNFFVLLFGVLIMMIVPVCNSLPFRLLCLPIIFVVSYVITILANTIRITCAIFLLQFKNEVPWIALLAIHEAGGIFIYLTILITTYLSVQFLSHKVKLRYAKST